MICIPCNLMMAVLIMCGRVMITFNSTFLSFNAICKLDIIVNMGVKTIYYYTGKTKSKANISRRTI